jgi:hypothetical protein
MNARLIVYPYKMGSESGKKLAAALDATRVKGQESDYKPKNGDFIIDWGCGYPPEWANDLKGKDIVVLNHWANICLSVNKVETFKAFKKGGVPHPEWTFHAGEAQGWLKEGHWVCCRHEVEGMDGAGLHLAKTIKEFQEAKLYTKYKPIYKEFRVYVFGDTLLDVREKRRDSDLLQQGKVNEYVRTTSGGWVFCEHGFTVPKDAPSVAIAATKALGLDFAGVDIIQAKDDGKCYALETNTAPYIGDHTVAKLAKVIFAKQKEHLSSAKEEKHDDLEYFKETGVMTSNVKNMLYNILKNHK